MRWKIEKQKIKVLVLWRKHQQNIQATSQPNKEKKQLEQIYRSRNDEGSNTVINQKSQLRPSQGLNRSIEKIFSKHLHQSTRYRLFYREILQNLEYQIVSILLNDLQVAVGQDFKHSLDGRPASWSLMRLQSQGWPGLGSRLKGQLGND